MNPIVFVFLAAVLIGLAFYLVALPLIQHACRNDSYEEVSSEEERLAELLAQRDSAFQALRELSFDHRVGKITDEDFVAFEVGLKQNAAETLRVLDSVGSRDRRRARLGDGGSHSFAKGGPDLRAAGD